MDSKNMISAADHGWDEQEYESDNYRDHLLQSMKTLEFQGKKENVPTSAGSVGCAGAGDERSALLVVSMSVHQQFLVNNPGSEGSVIPRSYNSSTMTSSTEANRIPLVDQLTANQLRDKSTHAASPERRKIPFLDLSGGSRTSRKQSRSVPLFNTKWTKRKSSGSPRPGDNSFNIHSAYGKGNRVTKNISVISRAGNGGCSSEGTRSTLSGGNNHHRAGSGGSIAEGIGSTITGGNNHQRETIASYNDMQVILDNQSQVNCTGKFEVLSDLNIGPENIVLIAANGEEMPTYMSGSVRQGNFDVPNVHFCPDVGDRVIVSGSELDKDDFKYEISRGEIIVTDLKTGCIVGEGRLVDGNYLLDYLKIPRDRTTGLVTTVWNTVCSALRRLGL